MTDKTNSAFTQQQRTQISNACERVQDAININNSTIAQLNADLVRKADEIAIKWRAYGLPYNAIRDAVLEMAMWQKEQMIKSAIDGNVAYFSEEHIREAGFAILNQVRESLGSTFGIIINSAKITEDIIKLLKGASDD